MSDSSAPFRAERDLTVAQRVTFSIPQIGVSIAGTVLGSWLMFYLVPPDDEVAAGKVVLVAAGVYGLLELWGRIVDSIADPLIGHWSDGTRTRWGRRLPFIIFGTPLLALSYLALWFLPFEAQSLGNTLYLGAVLTLYWIFFTVVLGPYSALLPELTTTSRGRVVLSSVMGLCGAVGAILGLASGEIVSAFPDGATLLGIHIPTGIQLVAVIGAVAYLLCLTPMLNIRETPHSAAKEVEGSLFDGMRSAAGNPAFMPVVGIAFCFKLAGAMMITMMPYLSTQVLERIEGQPGLVEPGMGEAWQGRLLGIVMLLAVLIMPFIAKISRSMSHKKLMIIAGSLYALGMLSLPLIGLLPDPAWGAVAVMVVLSFPTSIAFVMPAVLFADVIDFDEVRTGLRREGIYNGAVAFLTKWSEGLAKVAVVAILALGNSRSDPTGIYLVGPAAGVFMLLGLWFFRRYPQEELEEAVAAYRRGEACVEREVGPTVS